MLSQHDFVAIWGNNGRRVGMEGFPCSDRSENSFLEIELSKDLEKKKIKKIGNFFRVEIFFGKNISEKIDDFQEIPF